MKETENNIKTQNYIAEEIEYILSKNKMVARELAKIDRRVAKELGLSEELIEKLFSK